MGSTAGPFGEQPTTREIGEIRARRLVGDAMAGRVAFVGVGLIGVPDRVRQQGDLPAVQPLEATETGLGITLLGDLALQVEMKIADRLLDQLQLVDQEVGGVAAVGLGLEEGALVLGRRFVEPHLAVGERGDAGMRGGGRSRAVGDEITVAEFRHRLSLRGVFRQTKGPRK